MAKRNGADSTDTPRIRQKHTSPTTCRVCESPAVYSYDGAIVCDACKIFFRRNAQDRPNALVCKDAHHCQINYTNGRTCSSCRLDKCFAVGMKTHLIRSPWTKPNQTTSNVASQQIQHKYTHQQIGRLNLLEKDQSTFTTDQWNHLTNLIHCFDQYSQVELTNEYIEQQNKLPAKVRYKPASVYDFLHTMMSNIQLVFEKNRDLIFLSNEDRRLLLRSTIEHTTSIGASIVLRQSNLLDDQSFLHSCQQIFGQYSMHLIRRLVDQLDPDVTTTKIICAIVAFLVSDYTVYGSTPSKNLHNLKSLIAIQDIYTELLWKYLVYRMNFRDALLTLLNIVQCLLLLTNSVAEVHERQSFHQIIDHATKSTEQKLHLNT